MAGPDTKLSQKITGSPIDPTGGYLHIIIPDGGSWKSEAIEASTFLAASLYQIDKEVNKSADFTKAYDAGTKLLSVDFAHVSGSPKIKIGTTLGGSELSLSELPVPSGGYLPVNVSKIFSIPSTVYIAITGGTVNVNFTFVANFF